MLSKAKTLKGYKLDSLNGEIGKVRDFYFDDEHWTIRYLVADTGNWLTGRQVLISPYALAGEREGGKEEGLCFFLWGRERDRSLLGGPAGKGGGGGGGVFPPPWAGGGEGKGKK